MNPTAETYSIKFDEAAKTVVMRWNGYATSAQFREGTELMLDTLIQHKCTKVFGDISEMLLIGLDDQEWLEKYFVPRAIRFGLKAVAFVTPKSYFSKVSVESVSYKLDKEKLSINYFDDAEDAKEWLRRI